MGKKRKSATKGRSRKTARPARQQYVALSFVLIFLASHGILSWLYMNSPLREHFTDLLLTTAGKLCAVTTTDEIRVFYYIPDDGRSAYDVVFAMVALQSEVDAHNAAVLTGKESKPDVVLRHFVVGTYPLAFFPMSIVLSLSVALPVPWRRKLHTIPLSLLLTFGYVIIKWFCFIHLQATDEVGIPLKYFGFDVTSLFDALHRIMNRHFGFTFMVCILISIVSSFRSGDWSRLRSMDNQAHRR